MSIKDFSKNTIIYSIGSIGIRFSAFLLLPLYTKYLSVENFGFLQTLLLTIQIMITVIDVGVRSSIVRFLEEYKINNNIGLLLGSSLFINFLSSIIVTFISYLILVPFFNGIVDSENISKLILLVSLTAIFQTLSLNIMAYYRAQNESLRYMLVSIGAAVLLIVNTIIFLIYLEMEIEGVLISQIITYFFVWFSASIINFAKHGFSISKSAIRQIFHFGYPLIFAMSGDLITSTTAVYFLTFFHGLTEVAIYSLGFKLAQIATMIIIGPFQMAYEPYIYSQQDNPKLKTIIAQLTTYLLLSFGLISFLLVYILRDLMNILFTSSYSSSYFIVFFILPGIGLIGMQYIAQSLLHLKNKTNITGITIATVTILSIIINYFFIQYWSITGLIISYNIAMVLTTFVLFKYGLKEFPVKFEIKRLIIGTIIFLFLISLIWLLHKSPDYIFYSLPIISIFICIYALFHYKYFNTNEIKFIDEYISKMNLFIK